MNDEAAAREFDLGLVLVAVLAATAAATVGGRALPLGDAVAMPGGRRSRWSFEVVVSRDPFLPGVGMSFDESSGWVELHWPGRLHARRRVWLESAHPARAVGPRG